MSSETQRISEPSVFIRDRKERFEPGEMAELTLAAIWISLGLTHQETPNDPHRLPLRPKALPPNGTLLQGAARKKSITADVALCQGASIPDRQGAPVDRTGLQKQPDTPLTSDPLIGSSPKE
jgi:hypothetical protein